MTYPSFIPQSGFGVDLPQLGPLPEIVVNISAMVLFVSLVSFFALIIKKARDTSSRMPLPACVLFMTNLLMFSAPIGVTQVFYLFGATFFHSVQYVMVSAFYNQREHRSRLADNIRTKLRYFLSIAVLSSLFIAILPFLMTKGLGVAYEKSWVIVLVSVSLHHFLVDRELWKFRDKRNRQLLLNDDVESAISVGAA